MAMAQANPATHTDTNGAQSFLGRFWAGTVIFFETVGRSMALCRDLDRRIAQTNRLYAMSDAELAKMGLNRDQIHLYVYRDFLAN